MIKYAYCSIVKGRGYLNHNDRTIKQVNSRSWKPELSNQNIVYVNEPIQNVYHELFDSALDKYNAKIKQSKNPQRVIKDYYEHISRSKSTSTTASFTVSNCKLVDGLVDGWVDGLVDGCFSEKADFIMFSCSFSTINWLSIFDNLGRKPRLSIRLNTACLLMPNSSAICLIVFAMKSSLPPFIYSRFCQTCITNTICFFSVRMF